MLLSKFYFMLPENLVHAKIPRANHNSKLTLIVAPAGFGKSTLAMQIISEQPQRAAWLSLDEHDNDLSLFVSYVINALQQVNASIGQDALNALQSDDVPMPETLATLLTNSMVALRKKIMLVLDDYHLIHNADVLSFMERTITYATPNLNVVITSRHDPQMPARWRANGWIHDIRADDLRFSPQMASTYLNTHLNLNLAASEIDTLMQRTEGWISGLHLAGLALRSTTDRSGFVAQFGGSQRFVIDYLMEEVLQQQSDDLQDFMRQTAILARMNADLCAAVVNQNDCAQLLEHLYTQNLFLVSLGDGWFRYHHLFADVLVLSLSAEEKATLHHRAGNWFQDVGLLEEAVTHYLAANDVIAAVNCVADFALPAIGQGDHLRLKHLLSLLPTTSQALHPALQVAQSWFYAHAHQLDAAHAALDQITTQDEVVQAWMETIHALIAHSRGNMDAILPHIATARQHAQPPDLIGLYDWLSGVALWEQGQSLQAIDHVHAALRNPSVYNDPFGYSGINFFLSDYLNQMGRRQEALAICERLMADLVDADDNLMAHAAPMVGQAGILYYEADNLETAAYLLKTNIHLSEPMKLTQGLVLGRLYLALIDYARDHKEDAYRTLHDARHIATRTGSSPFTLAVDAVENGLYLRDGNVERVTNWLTQLPLTHPRLPFIVHLTAVRGWVYTEDARALSAIEILETKARQAGRERHLISLLILKALHYDHYTQHEDPLETLREAVKLAAMGDYSRAFLDEPPRLLALLTQVRDAAPTFVDKLLPNEAKPIDIAQSMVDPLTERELDVIKLAALGYSNREIAAKLFVAVSTVKTHIKHAFSKLDANGSRTRAIAHARQLGLLHDI
ncbi:MAG: LuxR C-terminal-related transcriptional regulator [Chloroflexota bacterium]